MKMKPIKYLFFQDIEQVTINLLHYPCKGIPTPKFIKGPSPQFSACHDITKH